MLIWVRLAHFCSVSGAAEVLWFLLGKCFGCLRVAILATGFFLLGNTFFRWWVFKFLSSAGASSLDCPSLGLGVHVFCDSRRVHGETTETATTAHGYHTTIRFARNFWPEQMVNITLWKPKRYLKIRIQRVKITPLSPAQIFEALKCL